MDRSDVITLISLTYTTDSMGQRIPQETGREVFCNVQSVTRAEWSAGALNGLSSAFVCRLFSPDYNGEKTALINNTRYKIYRVYRAKNEVIELYLAESIPQ